MSAVVYHVLHKCKSAWYPSMASIAVTAEMDELTARAVEAADIAELRPPFNRLRGYESVTA